MHVLNIMSCIVDVTESTIMYLGTTAAVVLCSLSTLLVALPGKQLLTGKTVQISDRKLSE